MNLLEAFHHDWGEKFSFLCILNLRSNNFVGDIPRELCYLTHIQILDLAHNNLLGSIPRCISNFSVLSGNASTSEEFYFYMPYGESTIATDSLVMKGREDTYSTILLLVTLIDLSSNKLSGKIPSELTALRGLTALNLSRNQLKGRIPVDTGDMKAIISFDVSLNKLSGELPMSLSSLNFLSSFNMSYNNLAGRIPAGTQIQSFNESSFFGNKLCGAPLTQQCARVKVPTDTEDQEEVDDGWLGTDWGIIVSILVGFFVGFWIILAPLIVSRQLRIAYFHFLQELRYKVYDISSKYCCSMFSRR
ncbi:receptor-like protein EIX2 [Tanacetum coccineum]|uniref:Receptor-like protein EIX2 n=1 Tax=Tanacetum coccineum TaxID=301880 RepID=A0ABQ5IWC3_9ASTR